MAKSASVKVLTNIMSAKAHKLYITLFVLLFLRSLSQEEKVGTASKQGKRPSLYSLICCKRFILASSFQPETGVTVEQRKEENGAIWTRQQVKRADSVQLESLLSEVSSKSLSKTNNPGTKTF